MRLPASAHGPRRAVPQHRSARMGQETRPRRAAAATRTTRVTDAVERHPRTRASPTHPASGFTPPPPRGTLACRARGGPMRQLTALDVQFLNAESTTTTGHVGGLS